MGFFDYLGRALGGNVDYTFTNKDKPALWQGAEADRATQAQSRGEEGDYQAYLQNQMAGKGPSVAQQQMAVGRDQAIKAGLATSASARGSGVAQAARGGAQAATQAGMQNAQQSAVLRAGEQQAAAQQYGQAVQTKRMQDLMAQGYTLEQAKAQLSYDAAIQQARSQQSIAETKANMQSMGAIAGMVGGVAGGIAMSDPAGKQDIMPAEGAADAIRPSAARVTNIQQPALAGALSKNPQIMTSPPEAKYDMNLMGAPAQPTVDPARSDTIMQKPGDSYPGHVPYNMDTLPKEAPDTSGTKQLNLGQSIARTLGLGMSGYAGGMSGDMRGYDQQLKMAQQQQAQLNGGLDQMGNPQPVQQSDDKGSAGGMGALGGALGGIIGSDPQLKQDVSIVRSGVETKQDLNPNEQGIVHEYGHRNDMPDSYKLDSLKTALSHPVSKAMEQVPAYTFRHKPEFAAETNAKFGLPLNSEYGNRLQTGVMAPDLAKNPVTQSAVIKDKNGMERVDTGRLTMTNTAAVSDLARRVSELESGKEQPVEYRTGTEPRLLRKGIGEYGALSSAIGKQRAEAVPQSWVGNRQDINITPYREEAANRARDIRSVPGVLQLLPDESRHYDTLKEWKSSLPGTSSEFAKQPAPSTRIPANPEEEWNGDLVQGYQSIPSPNHSMMDRYIGPEEATNVNILNAENRERKMGDLAVRAANAKTDKERRNAIREFAFRSMGGLRSVDAANPSALAAALKERGVKITPKQAKAALREEYDL
ncbi:MAG: hypothetical protein KGL39_39230 [Patescibacteria group bacterium]|nr:hypothetical protein [Patescibacteria group bacterium]